MHYTAARAEGNQSIAIGGTEDQGPTVAQSKGTIAIGEVGQSVYIVFFQKACGASLPSGDIIYAGLEQLWGKEGEDEEGRAARTFGTLACRH
jgi:hypothetical protein